MLPIDAQPLSQRGHARYEGSDSVEGLQDTSPDQVCFPLTSTDPQVSSAGQLTSVESVYTSYPP